MNEITNIARTEHELGEQLGENLRALRLDRNLDQRTLARRAGVSLHAVQNLEGGHGSTVGSLIAILRALGRDDWLGTIAPTATINPLQMTQAARPRRRASSPRKLRQPERG